MLDHTLNMLVIASKTDCLSYAPIHKWLTVWFEVSLELGDIQVGKFGMKEWSWQTGVELKKVK